MTMIFVKRSEGWGLESEFEDCVVRKYFVESLESRGVYSDQIQLYLKAIDDGFVASCELVRGFVSQYLGLQNNLKMPEGFLYADQDFSVKLRIPNQQGGWQHISINPYEVIDKMESLNHLRRMAIVKFLPSVIDFVVCHNNFVGTNYHEYYYCVGIKTVRDLQLDERAGCFERTVYLELLNDSIVEFLSGCIFSYFENGKVDLEYLANHWFGVDDYYTQPKKVFGLYKYLEEGRRLKFLEILLEALFVGTRISYEKGWENLGFEMFFNYVREILGPGFSKDDLANLDFEKYLLETSS